ncbi:MAG: hypothetical protein KDK91_12795 [Gammaproteobacteria bacterium]|nr:hypothetical protein [Gammaproteobacteria bacterium]
MSPVGASPRATPGEFEIIRRYFERVGAQRSDVLLGVGDDAAVMAACSVNAAARCATLVRPGQGERAALTLLNSAVWRLAETHALPAMASLALSLPEVDCDWLADFARTLDAAMRRLDTALVGGDTTSGTFCVSLFLHGRKPDSGSSAGAGHTPARYARGPGSRWADDETLLVDVYHAADSSCDSASLRWLLDQRPRLAALDSDELLATPAAEPARIAERLCARLSLPRAQIPALCRYLCERPPLPGALARLPPALLDAQPGPLVDGSLRVRAVPLDHTP